MSLAALGAHCFFCPTPADSIRPEASCQPQRSGARLWGVRQEDRGWARRGPELQGLLRLLACRPRGFGRGGSTRGYVPCCSVARPVRAFWDPLTFSGCDPPLRAHSGSLGLAGRVPPSRVFAEPRINVLVSCTRDRSSVDLSSAFPNVK